MSTKTPHKVYFHLGTERVGTTYLQTLIFPQFKGVHYISKKAYKKRLDIIKEIKDNRNIFISYEFGRSFEQDLIKYQESLPNSQCIIIFRKHGDFLASQYKRFIKNGNGLNFDEYFNLHQKSHISKDEMYYKQLLEYIEQYTSKKAWVFFYDDFRDKPKAFITRIAQLIGASFPTDKPLPKATHTSYSTDKLLVLRAFIRRFFGKKKMKSKILRYGILKLAPILKKPREAFIEEGQITAINDFYKEDWELCRTYAEMNNPKSNRS